MRNLTIIFEASNIMFPSTYCGFDICNPKVFRFEKSFEHSPKPSKLQLNTYFSTCQQYVPTFFRKCNLVTLKIIKNYIIWMFRRLGTMLKRFFLPKSFRFIYQSRKRYQETDFLIFRRSESRPAVFFFADRIVS